MPSDERTEPITVRLTPHELKLRNALAKHLGIDFSGVMRMGLLKLAREEGITLPETTKAVPEGTARRKR
jgi:antitoxin component of RelBE/YafQ-DinJ toxin-antitoxin module